MAPVRPILYGEPECPGCEAAREFFRSRGVDFIEKDIQKDPAAYSEFRSFDLPATPVIVVGQRRILGFQRRAVARALGLSI